jgi:uncharacterized membrane protein
LIYVAAALIGVVTGLRTFTGLAVLWVMRHRSVWAFLLAIAAVAEYAGDLSPKAPSRTALPGLAARLVSGVFCGWVIAGAGNGSVWAGALLGAAGAIAGAYGGLALRECAIGTIGAVPAALLEDAVAILGAVAIVAMSA